MVLPLTSTESIARMPEAIRQQSIGLLAEMLKAIVTAENNPSYICDHEHR